MRSILLSILGKVYSLLSKTFLRRIPYGWHISNMVFRLIWRNKEIIEIQGSRMYIDVNDPDPKMRKTFQAYGLNLIHEEATTALFKKIVKAGDVVLDLGANIGYFTLLAARLVGERGRVYAFEPEPKNFQNLRKNIEMNDYRNVYAYSKGVSNMSGKTKLFICPYDSGHHTINKPDGIKKYRPDYDGEIKEVEIDVVIADDFLKDKVGKIDVIKIDVEGAEVLAFNGMKNILKGNQNVKIFLEFFPLLIQEMGDSPEGLIRQLQEDYKFTIFAIARDYSINNVAEDYVKIQNYSQLAELLKGETDHTNLYLTRGLTILD